MSNMAEIHMLYCNVHMQVSVWSRPDVNDQTHYALDIATKVLSFYEQSFGIPYPLPKLGEYW